MAVVKGLQKLLLKMGGHPESGDNSDELVRKIAEAYDPSIQVLPSATGKNDCFLHVNETTGALEWTTIPMAAEEEGF